MSIKINQTATTPNIINALDAMKADENINLGIEEIEFPDGSKEKFCYNGESDKQAAVHFAQICIDVCAGDSDNVSRQHYECWYCEEFPWYLYCGGEAVVWLNNAILLRW